MEQTETLLGIKSSAQEPHELKMSSASLSLTHPLLLPLTLLSTVSACWGIDWDFRGVESFISLR